MDSPALYKLLDHTADYAIQVDAPTPEGLFHGAALALYDLMIQPQVPAPPPAIQRGVEAAGADRTDLFVNWLRLALEWFTIDGLVLDHLKIQKLTPHAICALADLRPFDPQSDRVAHEIKAVTFHQARVEATPSGWRGRVVLDV